MIVSFPRLLTKHVSPRVHLQPSIARRMMQPPLSRESSSTRTKVTKSGTSQWGQLLIDLCKGNDLWYQSTETVSEFLKRCPPHTTVMEESGIDWFWIDNPNTSAQSERDPDIQTFTDTGDDLLDDYRRKRAELEKQNLGMRKGVITGKLTKDREKLKQQIAELARETHVVCGKVVATIFYRLS